MLTKLRSSRFLYGAMMVLAAVLAVAFVMPGVIGGGRSKKKQTAEATAEAQAQARELRARIATVEKAALKKNPALEARRRELEGLIRDGLRKRGHEPGALEKSVAELRAQLAKKPAREERDKLLEKVREQARAWNAAERQVLADPKVQKLHLELKRDLLAAMKKEDPNIEGLIQKYLQSEAQLESGGEDDAPTTDPGGETG